MKATLTLHRKAPNRAVLLLLASAKVIADPIVCASWHPGACEQIVDALQKVWQDGASEYHCKAENMHISSNVRYRQKPNEDYHIWLTWGTSNGGDVLATLTLAGP